VTWRFVLNNTVLKITIQSPTCNTSIRPSSVQTVQAFDRKVSKRTWIITSLFRNFSSPLCTKKITVILRHSEQCLFPSPKNAFVFTNLYRSVLEIYRFCEYHAEHLNTLQKNSVSWDLQLGFNSVFKGLNILTLPNWLNAKFHYSIIELTVKILNTLFLLAQL